MRVRAIAEGYDNVAVRQPGDEFDLPDGAKGKWFVPVEPKAKPGRASRPPVEEDNASLTE